MNFTAADSFDVILEAVRHHLRWRRAGRAAVGGLFVDRVPAISRRRRARFISRARISTRYSSRVTITPLELTAGWQFRLRRAPRFRPYLGGGLTSYSYKES